MGWLKALGEQMGTSIFERLLSERSNSACRLAAFALRACRWLIF